MYLYTLATHSFKGDVRSLGTKVELGQPVIMLRSQHVHTWWIRKEISPVNVRRT